MGEMADNLASKGFQKRTLHEDSALMCYRMARSGLNDDRWVRRPVEVPHGVSVDEIVSMLQEDDDHLGVAFCFGGNTLLLVRKD